MEKLDQEDFDYKLSRNNPVLIGKVISDVVELIKKKCESNLKENSCLQFPEYKYLKQKCLSADPALCCAAGDALVYITKHNFVELPKMMSEITAMIPFTQNHRGLLIVLMELLLMDMDAKLQQGEYKCPFNLALPQHPIISILVHNADSWNDILNYIRKLYRAAEGKSQHSLNTLLRPVYLYVLSDPHMKMPELSRTKFLKFLLEENRFGIALLPEIISWLQLSSSDMLTYTSNVLMEIYSSQCIKEDKQLQEFVLFSILSLLYEFYMVKRDPSEIILMLTDSNNPPKFTHINIVMLLLAKCLSIVPPVYLWDLLDLCLKIVPDENVNEIIASSIKASLLNWILYPSVILEDCMSLINKLFNKITIMRTTDEIDLSKDENQYMMKYKSTNQHLYLTFELCSILKDKSSLHNNIQQFLTSAQCFSGFLLKHSIALISGIFIYDSADPKVTLTALSLILRHSTHYSYSSQTFLTLLVFKLGNCKDSTVQFEIWKGLVQFGKAKENLHVVVSMLKSLGNAAPQMKTMSLNLFFELWRQEPKYYVLLQNLLTEENQLDRENYYIAKAHVIKELCRLKPELYGSELAIYISKVLNTCRESDGIASSFALEGLTDLCTKGIIDITTAWDTLEPSLRTETRSNVIVSFCNLLAELPNLYVETEKFDKMIVDVIEKLWYYILNVQDSKVLDAAYNALAGLNMEQVSQQFIASYDSEEVTKDPWFILLLRNNSYNHIEPTVKFLVNCISREVAEFGRGIYYILESKAEPANYEYLPSKSILRGLMWHIKRNLTTKSPIEITAFKIISHEYSKPLPPLDWCFLQEFVHDPNFRQYCIAIGAHQVILSGTARRFIENLMAAITVNPNCDELLTVLSNLKPICNSIQPVIMRPFLTSALNFAIDSAQNEHDYVVLDKFIDQIGRLMLKSDFQDVNKTVVAQVLTEKADEVSILSSVYSKLVEGIILLPYTYIKPLINPKLWTGVTSDKLRRSIVIAGELARNTEESPLAYFNDIIGAIASEQIDQEYFLNQIGIITQALRDHNSLPNWFLELLGQTQLELIDSHTFSKGVEFMCNILMMTIVSVSGHKAFLKSGSSIDMDHLAYLLPQAFVFILKEEKWNKYTTQVLEWLYYIINYESAPAKYKRAFYQALIALRHEPEFKGSLRWLKYVGCEIKC